ncbi:MAG: ImmA/IrrE family metallo-endopeptidase [FCB group bacterium]|nr:ImmA/IrrE family metallo-endopeptidase [FCB group bacterium]
MTVSLNSVPFLTNDEIEQQSWNLIWDFSQNESWNISAPIPVETIAENYLKYQIEITTEGLFKEPGVLGGIIFEENTIQVNGAIENQEGRYNFTVAHELGHHSLHKNWLNSIKNQQTLFDTDEAPGILCREVGKKPYGEIQADKFAAALLMPPSMVTTSFRHVYSERINLKILSDSSSFWDNPNMRASSIAEEVIDAGNFQNVSITAMVNRLITLKLITGIEYQRNDPILNIV